MAEPEYREVLRLLVLLNSSVKFIVLRLRELSSEKLISADYIDRLAKATQEVDRFLKDPDVPL
jgi:pantoate kinase